MLGSSYIWYRYQLYGIQVFIKLSEIQPNFITILAAFLYIPTF
jgi:hypothetical protein